MARRPRYLKRSQYVRVDNNGIRVNSPDGWLGQAIFGADVPPDSPFAWVGSDSWAGPGSWTGLPSGWDASRVSSVILPAVERCTGVITSSIIRTDWARLDSQGVELPMPLWVLDPMLTGTVPGNLTSNTPAMDRLGATDFWTSFLTTAMWYGRSFAIYVEGQDGQPLAGTFRLLNPFLVGYRDGEWLIGDPADPVVVPFDGRFDIGGQTFRLLTMRGLSPNDGSQPEGILTRHYETLRVGAMIRSYVSGAFASGNQPSGFLKVTTPNFTPEQADELKQKWMAAHGGSRRSVAILNATTDYSPLTTVKPTDAEVADVAHVTRADVALCFGLDPIWVGEGAGGLTYNNASDRRADLVSLTASMWGQRLMDCVSSVLPYGQRFVINWKTFIIPISPADPGAEHEPPAYGGAPAASDPEG